ncbi:MAG: Cardiolipin synthetase [Deltaproteobacteria bacterium]|nr:Cardiolipin synthetase [Deltaproteobacteria bacterium]
MAGSEGFANALFQSLDAELSPGTVKRVDNGAVFDAIVEDLDRATSSINISMYIWETGEASRRITAAIVTKAKAGVACRLSIDALGSSKFQDQVAPVLLAAGCEVRMFRPIAADSVTTRNHRKLVIIDGAIAITGGFGIRDDWMGDGVTGWRDTNVRFTGPAVRDAQQAFAESWQESGGALLPATDFPRAAAGGGSRLALVTSTASPHLTRAERLVQLLIAASQKRLWITMAYYAPSKGIRAMLASKAKSGVDVRLLVPDEHNDSKVALKAQRLLYDELAAAGVKVWEYQPSMIHAKTFVVDDHLSAVGSINLDPLSLNRLDEDALVIDDPAFTEQLAAVFLTDSAKAVQVVPRPGSLANAR